MNKVHYVYKITNRVNNKFYVGVHYGRVDDCYMGSGKLIRQAIDKYGVDSFDKQILAVFENGIEAFEYETTYIQAHNLHILDDCYNLSPNHNRPGSALGGVTYEVLYGEEKAQELKHMRSEQMKSRVVSEETKQKQSDARKGSEPWNKGLSVEDPRVLANIEKMKTTKRSNPKPSWNKGITSDEYRSHYGEKGLTSPSMIGRIWINNGIDQRKIMATDDIPNGWTRGRCDNKGDNNPMRKQK